MSTAITKYKTETRYYYPILGTILGTIIFENRKYIYIYI